MIDKLKKLAYKWAAPEKEEIQTQLDKLTLFADECSQKHIIHENRDRHHDHLYSQHEDLIQTIVATQTNMAATQKTMSETQTNMAETQKSMSESLTIFSEFIKKHEPNFDIVAKVISALGGVKSAVGWLAAVIGGLGIIIGGMLATWMYVSTSIPITELFGKF